MTEFGQYIRRAREQNTWSLREAAKQLRLPHSRLFELENGFSSKTGKPVKPTTENLELLARGYDLPIDHLVALAYFPHHLRETRDLSGQELTALDLYRSLPPAKRDLWMKIGQGLKDLPREP